MTVDQGFYYELEQKLRLRGIDAPEISTSGGRRAKRIVQKKLSGCEFVVIKTYKSDKYDRYLTDLFYLAGEKDAAKVAASGKFLNQELLDEGLARVWRE